jgi:hypothetical protein
MVSGNKHYFSSLADAQAFAEMHGAAVVQTSPESYSRRTGRFAGIWRVIVEAR